MADSIKYVKLKRSETCGFGFSILGGAGSELPPIIYDIIEGSPAANSHQLTPGDIIWEVNGQEVISYTTKEVLNCLRLSSSEVTLKLKTDGGVQERVRQYLARPHNPEVLRGAITQDDLAGVRHIKAKRSSRTPPEPSSRSPPSLPSPTLSDASDRCSLGRAENGVQEDMSPKECHSNGSAAPASEAYLMTGDLILNLSRTPHSPAWLPQQRTVDDLRKSGSASVPTSPNELIGCGGRLARPHVGSPHSLCSPVCDNNATSVQFTYPPTSAAVRISKSDDQLQYRKDLMCAVNIELEDDVTSSLNTLLDTCDNPSPSPTHPCAPSQDDLRDSRIVWSFNAPPTTSSPPDSMRSSHDSDSPLIRSPSPTSPQSPTSSMQYSCSGVYDKMCSGRDSLGSSNRSENVLSNSSSLTSPDTDVPDELEWDDTTPTYGHGGAGRDLLPNGHGVGDRVRVRRQDDNRIVIKVEGPEGRPRPQQLSRDKEPPPEVGGETGRDPDLTPTNTRPPTPGSGTLSPDTLAYQELRESEDEITCLSEEDGGSRAGRTPTTASPPLSEDESDIDSLHSFHYSPKAVDIPSAVRLAKRLISLDGFKKTDVSRHLSKNNEFSRAVAEEYLNYFDFRGDTLDMALRKFLDKFCLTGETQERERVLVHFSQRFLNCNPGTFNSQDAVHTLTCAIMLLNTDLHGQSTGRKMTCGEFIDNLADLNDGENFPRDVLKALYHAIRTNPLQWAKDEEGDGDGSGGGSGGSGKGGGGGGGGGVASEAAVAVGSNPFLTPPSGTGTQYKKGYIMRKCCTDPNGKRTAFGKRSWKMWFCVIQDLVLYLHKDEQGARRGPQHAHPGHTAIRLHHALATRANDYSKKEHVFRLQTADQAEYLLQTSDSKELQAWIDTINLVAASLSAAPLPGAVGSQRRFQRPLLPCTITKLNMSEQLEDHTQRLAQLEQELEEHQAHPPDRSTRAASMANYKEKEAYLSKEVKRYRTYVFLLRSRLATHSQQSASAGVEPPQDLPVFEARVSGEGAEGGDRGGRVVPPPIPERARPADSPSLSDKCAHSLIIPPVGDQDSPVQEAKGSGNEEDTRSEKGTLRKKNKEERERRKLEKEREKFVKEVEKKEKEVEKKEKAREKKEKDQQRKEKEKEKKGQDKMEQKKQKEEKNRANNKEKNGNEANDITGEGKTDDEVKPSKDEEKTIDENKTKESEVSIEQEDPGVGTINRLTALFKFKRLNRRSYTVKEGDEGKGKVQSEENAPPLPPKPHPDSPVMKNVGTRINI